MQKSGFFNALLTNGEYDRKYNANDYCDNLAVVISNGVLRGVDDDLKVSSAGMVVSVGVGRAWIEGHYYLNDTPYSFAAISAPIGGTRYDRVFLRLNKNLSVRSVSLVYQQGEAGNNPTKPAPVRDGNIYDIVLADIFVNTNATSVQITDTRADADLCGWVYSTSGDNSFFTSLDNAFNTWFEEKKETLATVTTEVEHKQLTVLSAAGKTVQITIPQYDAAINQKLDVYVNGIRQYSPNDYTVSGKIITFAGNLIAGTEVAVYITVSKDGSGIPSVIEDIIELQIKVEELEQGLNESTYTYICNGVDDNVKIGDLVRAFIAGDGYGAMKINVYGTFGATAPARGSGTSSSAYGWFNFGTASEPTRKVVVDFSNCSDINIPIQDGTVNIIFFGNWINIIGANVIVNNTSAATVVRGFFSTGIVNCANSRFWITSYQDSFISNTGTFTDCRGSVANILNNSWAFLPSTTSLLRIIGGEYYAYIGNSTGASAVVGQSAANAVSILYAVNAPTTERSGFYQTDAIKQYAGGGMVNCTDIISTLPVSVIAGISNIRGTIAKNKPNQM